MKIIGLILLASLSLTACVSVDVSRYIVPGETLDKEGSYHIVISENDGHDLHELLKTNMLSKGLFVSFGTREDMPDDVTYLVEYGGQWQWDISWYLLNFNIRIYQPGSKLLVASSNSLRTSLGRKSAERVVVETLEQLFK